MRTLKSLKSCSDPLPGFAGGKLPEKEMEDEFQKNWLLLFPGPLKAIAFKC